ncbi:MAG: LysR family transcriptional regulator [Polyangiaceae bacterium]
MTWTAFDFDWNQARTFLVTAREGSLSAAARKLAQTQPTLSRQVAALEKQLGVTLFERVGKRLVLTETGAKLLEHVRAMAEAADLVVLGATGRSQAVVGQVRISASEMVAAYLLPPIVERLRKAHPELDVHIVVSNRLSDLLRREADIAIRHVRPEQPDLFARKVRDSSAHLYAATRYIERHGRPLSLDLTGFDFVGGADNEQFVAMLRERGVRVELDNFKWTTDSHLVAWEMLRRGLGISGMLREIAAATPDVEQILPDLAPIPVPYWLCTHRELYTSQRIRVTFDMLAQALSGALPEAARPRRGSRRRSTRRAPKG